VVIMMEGRVVQTGSPTEVWDHPNDERVAALLGLGTLVDASVRAGEARVGGLPLAAVWRRTVTGWSRFFDRRTFIWPHRRARQRR
jgi:ABC-type sulfate/molybdate transport systems ATPase subunit